MEELEPEAVPLEPTCFAPTARPAPVLLPELEPTSVGEAFAARTAALPAASVEALEWIEPTCQVVVEGGAPCGCTTGVDSRPIRAKGTR